MILKVLIQTDFSELSEGTFHYATALEEKLKAECVLLHPVFIGASPRTTVQMNVYVIEDVMVDHEKQDSILLIAEIVRLCCKH